MKGKPQEEHSHSCRMAAELMGKNGNLAAYLGRSIWAQNRRASRVLGVTAR